MERKLYIASEDPRLWAVEESKHSDRRSTHGIWLSSAITCTRFAAFLATRQDTFEIGASGASAKNSWYSSRHGYIEPEAKYVRVLVCRNGHSQFVKSDNASIRLARAPRGPVSRSGNTTTANRKRFSCCTFPRTPSCRESEGISLDGNQRRPGHMYRNSMPQDRNRNTWRSFPPETGKANSDTPSCSKQLLFLRRFMLRSGIDLIFPSHKQYSCLSQRFALSNRLVY